MTEPEAAGFVLAGGRSSRMGSDKALAVLRARPLVEHSLDLLRGACATAAIAGARSALSQFAPVVEDVKRGAGPLAGICAAMASMPEQWAVFLSIDLPLLPSSLLSFILRHAYITQAPVTVAAVNGFAQSFPVVLHKAALPALQDELEAGRSGCYRAFQTASASLGQPISVLPVEFLVQTGELAHPANLPPAQWFLNVNDAKELRRAEGLLDRIELQPSAVCRVS
jgi:molybdopterin-guanine dinucleotide biosynthesis protein A